MNFDSEEESKLLAKLEKIRAKEAELDKEIEEMEKEKDINLAEVLILAKVVSLNINFQQCQTKADVQTLFDEMGVSHDNKEIIYKYQEILRKEAENDKNSTTPGNN